MATFIKAADCGAGCPESVCCDIDEAEVGGFPDGPGTFTFNYTVTGTSGVVQVDFTIDIPSPPMFARLVLEADGTPIYDSGCISTSDSDTATVPPGTTTLSAIVTQECAGSWAENTWDFSIVCAT